MCTGLYTGCTLDHTVDCTLPCMLGCALVLYTRLYAGMCMGLYTGLHTALYTRRYTCAVHKMRTRCGPDVPKCIPDVHPGITHMCSIGVTDVSRCIPDVAQIYPRYAPDFQMGSRCISNVFQMCLDLFQMCTWAIHCTLDCT